MNTVITVRIDDIEKDTLVEYAKDKDLTLSQVIRRAIREFIAKECE